MKPRRAPSMRFLSRLQVLPIPHTSLKPIFYFTNKNVGVLFIHPFSPFALLCSPSWIWPGCYIVRVVIFAHVHNVMTVNRINTATEIVVTKKNTSFSRCSFGSDHVQLFVKSQCKFMLFFLFLCVTIFYHILWYHYHLYLLIVVPAFCEHGKIDCSYQRNALILIQPSIEQYRFVCTTRGCSRSSLPLFIWLSRLISRADEVPNEQEKKLKGVRNGYR
jgi:hypothetical protein